MSVAAPAAAPNVKPLGALELTPLLHPQGCRAYLLGDPESREAIVIDPHLDMVREIHERVEAGGWKLRWILDTHTHADHPSGAGRLKELLGGRRIAHAQAKHRGVDLTPKDGEVIAVGGSELELFHAPGHTPDHIVMTGQGGVFAGDTLFIGAVARTDFLGGDAGELYDTIHRIYDAMPADTLLYPGHDYAGKWESTLQAERDGNPWLHITDRSEFVKALTANPPRRPANMDALLELNREGVDIPGVVSAAQTIERVNQGGATSVIDVRTDPEVEEGHVEGSRHIVLDQVVARADEVRATPAPRLIMCRTGKRARTAKDALEKLGVEGLSVIEGGIIAYQGQGGETIAGKPVMSLERQVRIVAGALVVIGVALGFLVHPAFFGLAAFIGAGQVFAGVTDTCGMAMALAKMPWNRRSTKEPAAAAGGCAATDPGGCAATPPPTAGGCAATPPDA